MECDLSQCIEVSQTIIIIPKIGFYSTYQKCLISKFRNGKLEKITKAYNAFEKTRNSFDKYLLPITPAFN